MTEKRIRCDCCGASPALEVHYDYDRVRDAAGAADLEYKTKDLCAVHMQVALQEFLYNPKGEVDLKKKQKEFSDHASRWNWAPKA